MSPEEMEVLLEVCAYDCRKGNTSDHYYRVFEDRRLVQSEVPFFSLRQAEIPASRG